MNPREEEVQWKQYQQSRSTWRSGDFLRIFQLTDIGVGKLPMVLYTEAKNRSLTRPYEITPALPVAGLNSSLLHVCMNGLILDASSSAGICRL